MSNVTGELRNWWYDCQRNIYCGEIFCDMKRRWIDGRVIATSTVLAVVDKGECLYAVTLNSTYRLYKNKMRATHVKTTQRSGTEIHNPPKTPQWS